MAFKESTDKNFNEQIGANKLSLVQFSASWCGPCRKIKPMVLKLQEGLQTNNIKFYVVDIDANGDLCEK